jgi:hypothetical protein
MCMVISARPCGNAAIKNTSQASRLIFGFDNLNSWDTLHPHTIALQVRVSPSPPSPPPRHPPAMKREREMPCPVCLHYHKWEEGETCTVCGHVPTAEQQAIPKESAFPTEVLADFLYLGSYDNAASNDLLKAVGIRHIVNTVRSRAPLSPLGYAHRSLTERSFFFSAAPYRGRRASSHGRTRQTDTVCHPRCRSPPLTAPCRRHAPSLIIPQGHGAGAVSHRERSGALRS